jgi:hypothetical protein
MLWTVVRSCRITPYLPRSCCRRKTLAEDTVRHLAFQIRHWLYLDLVLYHKKDDRDVMVVAEEEDAVTGKHTGQNRVSFRGPTRKPPPHRNAGTGTGVVDLTCRVEEVLFLSTSHQLAIVISSAPWYRLADTPKSSLSRSPMN